MILICSRVHCTHMFMCPSVHMSVCTHVHYTHMFTCSPVHMSVCIYVHILICSHVRTDPSTLEHLLCPHVHWRTYVTLSYSCIHVSQSRNYVSCVIYVPQSPSQQSRQRANACLRSRISAYAHAVYRHTCSSTPSIICTGSHPLHPLTNNRTKRERGVGTGDSQYPMTLYPSLHAISRSSSSPATSGRPQLHLTDRAQGPPNPTTPRGC